MLDDLKDLEYLERLKALRLWILEERRNCADVINLNRIMHAMSEVALDMFSNVHHLTAPAVKVGN